MQTTVTFDFKRSFRLRHFSGFGGFFPQHVWIFAGMPIFLRQSRNLDATLEAMSNLPLSSWMPYHLGAHAMGGGVEGDKPAEAVCVFESQLLCKRMLLWLSGMGREKRRWSWLAISV